MKDRSIFIKKCIFNKLLPFKKYTYYVDIENSRAETRIFFFLEKRLFSLRDMYLSIGILYRISIFAKVFSNKPLRDSQLNMDILTVCTQILVF